MKVVMALIFGLCHTEDSANCVWDARIQGNGEGISFLHVGGEEVAILVLLGN